MSSSSSSSSTTTSSFSSLADAIMSSVQKLIELMATSFAEETARQQASSSSSNTTSSASASSSSSSFTPHFSGLPPDELQRVSILSRAEAVQLRSLFKAASSELESSPGLLLTTSELDEMEEEIQRREERVEALLKILPENPSSITALTGEAERYEENIRSINWPLETSSASSSASSSSSSSSSSMQVDEITTS